MQQKLKESLLKIVMVALCISIVAIWVAYFFPMPSRAAYFYASGRAEFCSFLESIQAASATASQQSRATHHYETGKLLERSDDGTELWSTDSGDWWFPTGSRDAMVFDLAEQDRDIYRTEPDGIGPGDVVLDCGANIGLFAAKALSRGAARVIAIEPAPNNLVVLRKNLAKEIESGRVTIYPKGVWDKEDVLPMYLDPDNAAANSFLRDGNDALTVNLPLTTIDLITKELQLERVDFIKLDIEGAEKRALAGAVETIRRFKPRIALCLYHLDDDPVQLPAEVFKIEPDYRLDKGCMINHDLVLPQIAHFR